MGSTLRAGVTLLTAQARAYQDVGLVEGSIQAHSLLWPWVDWFRVEGLGSRASMGVGSEVGGGLGEGASRNSHATFYKNMGPVGLLGMSTWGRNGHRLFGNSTVDGGPETQQVVHSSPVNPFPGMWLLTLPNCAFQSKLPQTPKPCTLNP